MENQVKHTILNRKAHFGWFSQAMRGKGEIELGKNEASAA